MFSRSKGNEKEGEDLRRAPVLATWQRSEQNTSSIHVELWVSDSWWIISMKKASAAYWFRATFIIKPAHVLLLVLPRMTASQRQKWNLLKHIFSSGQMEVSKHRFKLLHLHFTALLWDFNSVFRSRQKNGGKIGKIDFRSWILSHGRDPCETEPHVHEIPFWHHSFVALLMWYTLNDEPGRFRHWKIQLF